MKEKMKTNLSHLTVPVYFVAAILMIWGISLEITEQVKQEGTANILFAGCACMILFIFLAVQELWRSDNITKKEKWIWSAGIVLLNLAAGLIYVIVGRNKVLGISEADE